MSSNLHLQATIVWGSFSGTILMMPNICWSFCSSEPPSPSGSSKKARLNVFWSKSIFPCLQTGQDDGIILSIPALRETLPDACSILDLYYKGGRSLVIEVCLIRLRIFHPPISCSMHCTYCAACGSLDEQVAVDDFHKFNPCVGQETFAT